MASSQGFSATAAEFAAVALAYTEWRSVSLGEGRGSKPFVRGSYGAIAGSCAGVGRAGYVRGGGARANGGHCGRRKYANTGRSEAALPPRRSAQKQVFQPPGVTACSRRAGCRETFIDMSPCGAFHLDRAGIAVVGERHLACAGDRHGESCTPFPTSLSYRTPCSRRPCSPICLPAALRSVGQRVGRVLACSGVTHCVVFISGILTGMLGMSICITTSQRPGRIGDWATSAVPPASMCEHDKRCDLHGISLDSEYIASSRRVFRPAWMRRPPYRMSIGACGAMPTYFARGRMS